MKTAIKWFLLFLFLRLIVFKSILKEISPGCSLEEMMLLKLQYFATSCEELTHWKILWYWEGLGAGGEGDDRGWDGWMISWTRWKWVWVNSRSWWWTGRPGESWNHKESDMTEWLNWIDRVSNIDIIESQKHICLVVVLLSSVISSHWQRVSRLRGQYFSSSSSGWKQKTHWGTSLCVNLVFLRKSQVPDGLFPSFLLSFLPSYFPASLFLSFLGLIHSIWFYLINV